MNTAQNHDRRRALATMIKISAGIGMTGMLANNGNAVEENRQIGNSFILPCGPYTSRITACRQASDKALGWLESKLFDDGSFGPEVREPTGYFKVAYLFCIAGRLEQANRLMSHIKKKFMQPNGDFKYSGTEKSHDVDYYEKVWGYANAWITFTSHKLGRFDISYPAYRYLEKLFNSGIGGYISNDPDSADEPIIELLSTTHMGHTSLYLGQLERAEACGKLIIQFERRQKNSGNGMYLRMDKQQNFITEYPDEEAAYYILDATKPDQLYFMAGYPAAFLGLLYRVTGNSEYLDSAIRYFNFAVNCKGVKKSHFSHKVAWGAAILYNITKDERYVDFAFDITDLLLEIQSNEGAWFYDSPPFVSYDQTAECAGWLRQISSEICVT